MLNLNNQSPNSKHQINSNHQIPITKLIRFAKLVIVHCLLFGYWCLVIGISNGYALNSDKVKVYFLNGDYKSAILDGEKILATPRNASDLDELYYILALSYLKDGNYLRASDIFEIILKEFKHSAFREKAKLGLGDTYFLKGDYDKAQGYYKEMLNSYPQTKFKAHLYYRLSQVAAKLGDTQEAKEYLEKLKNNFPLNPELRSNQDLAMFFDKPFLDFYYTVQVGSFSNASNARGLCDKLIKSGYAAFIQEVEIDSKKTYRVKVGKLKSRQEALQLGNKLSQEGYPTKICP